MNETLKTCPACDSAARVWYCGGTNPDGLNWGASCTRCTATLNGGFASEEAAVEGWNALPRREQKAESRWYYSELELTLRQYPEARLYNALNPDGKHTSISEHLCAASGDKRISDSEARALIAKWQTTSNPAPAPEPAPADEQVREMNPLANVIGTNRCPVCNGPSVGNVTCSRCRLATPPTPQPQPALERVWVCFDRLGKLPHGNAYGVRQDLSLHDEEPLQAEYILASIHEAKLQAAVELAAIAEAKVKELEQKVRSLTYNNGINETTLNAHRTVIMGALELMGESGGADLEMKVKALVAERDHASDMANAATARVAELEAELAQLRTQRRDEEVAHAAYTDGVHAVTAEQDKLHFTVANFPGYGELTGGAM
jgi:hypothetical protein